MNDHAAEAEKMRELQKIDCNCNDCKFMKRDMAKFKSFDKFYTNEVGQVTSPSYRIQYGDCEKFNKPVSFIPNTCQLDTQECFEDRKQLGISPDDNIKQ